MKLQIKKRLKKGYKLTHNQIEWLKEHIDIKFDPKCEHCMFNALNYFGLLS